MNELVLYPPNSLNWNARILSVAGGSLVGANVNVANWEYFGLFFRLDHIAGTPDLLGIRVTLEGSTTGIISGGANIYGSAIVLEIRSFAAWFSWPSPTLRPPKTILLSLSLSSQRKLRGIAGATARFK